MAVGSSSDFERQTTLARPGGAGTPIGSPEKITHHKLVVLLAQVLGLVSAGVAGFGVAAGLLTPGAGWLRGYLVPIVVGIGLAALVGLAWHILFMTGARVRSRGGYTFTALKGGGVAILQLLFSAWAIATGLSGASAVQQHRQEAVGMEQAAMAKAWDNVAGEVPMVDVVKAAAGQVRGLSAVEEKGYLSKKPGKGSLSFLLNDAANRYDELASTMVDDVTKAVKLHDRGLGLLRQLEMTDNTDEFAKTAIDTQSVIAALANSHIADRANAARSIRIDAPANDAGTRAASASVDRIAASVIARMTDIVDGRQTVNVPSFEPIQPREATLEYMGAAAGGWATAIGIDLMPLLALMLVMATSKEPLLLRDRPGQQKKEDEVDYDGRLPSQSAPPSGTVAPNAPSAITNGKVLQNGQDSHSEL